MSDIIPVVFAAGSGSRFEDPQPKTESTIWGELDMRIPKLAAGVDNQPVLRDALYHINRLGVHSSDVRVVTGHKSDQIESMLEGGEQIIRQDIPDSTLTPAAIAVDYVSASDTPISPETKWVFSFGDDGPWHTTKDYQELLRLMDRQRSEAGVLLTRNYDPSAFTTEALLDNDNIVRSHRKIDAKHYSPYPQRRVGGLAVYLTGVYVVTHRFLRSTLDTIGGSEGRALFEFPKRAMEANLSVTGHVIDGPFVPINEYYNLGRARHAIRSQRDLMA